MPSRLTVVLLSLLVATPAVIFWLWLVILRVNVAILCPEGCLCGTAGHYVICYGSSLNNILLTFPTNVRHLWLTGNNITSLENDSFISRGLTELKELRVERCGLKTLELGAFNGLSKLKNLFLQNNEISEITPGTFENMSCLKRLFLCCNKFERLEFDLFSGLINLKDIDLRKNKLQYLHPDLFAGLPRLRNLDLARNPDLQIPTDRRFITSHSLSHLDISNCNVSSVSAETFSNVTALEWLDLGYNNLSSVDINILKTLPELWLLDLRGNPLQCDCQLQEVWRWCQDHNIRTAFGEVPECDTPSEVQGIWWGVLEKGQCLQGDMYYYLDYNDSDYNESGYNESDYNESDYNESDYNESGYSYDDDGAAYRNEPYESRYRFLQHYKSPLYAVPFTVGTTGNVILLIIIICNKDMRTVPNMYILNLAISDMFYLLVHFAESFTDTKNDAMKDGDFMCRFLPFCRRLSVGLSAYSVAVLSIQRYRVTVNPLHVRVSSQRTRRATVATICGVWIVAALFALPSALSKQTCPECYDTLCLRYYKNVVLFELLVSCVLPLCVIAFSYIMTARHLLKSAQPISEETQNPRLNTRTNTAKIVLGLTVVFLISYVPFHVFWTYIILKDEQFYDESDIPFHPYVSTNFKIQNGYTYFVSTCLLLINPCLNPVALFCTGRAFRRQIKRYLTCCYKASPPITNIELRRRN